MLIGYARVSTADQTLDLQKDALQQAGCTKIFTDTASGAKAERTGLDEALNYVRNGDTLVVWRLDRLGRSLKHLIETITTLNNRNIGFKSITENIDTTTSGGKLVFHIFGALAEFERDIIQERTNAGLTAARARGRNGGRPKSLTGKKAVMLQALYKDKNNTLDEICKTFNISKATLYRYVKNKIAGFIANFSLWFLPSLIPQDCCRPPPCRAAHATAPWGRGWPGPRSGCGRGEPTSTLNPHTRQCNSAKSSVLI